MTERTERREISAPPGVCDECLRNSAFIWNATTVTIHCHHTNTGAVGIETSEGIQWHAWRPITRERFEAVAAQAARDASGGGGAEH